MDAAKKAGQILAAGSLLLAAAGSAQAGGNETLGAEALGGGVQVHRGADVTLETDTQNKATRDEQGVAVHRGSVPKRTLKPAAAPPRRVTVAAGEDFWLFDSSSGRLVACELRRTSTVGRNAIACTRTSTRRLRF